MIKLNCTICGGELDPAVGHIAQCPYCGSRIVLPHIDDDIRADLFNRGTYYRRIFEFDLAASAFEHIIAQDPTDSEAYFCLMLCHLGVEYVQDPRTKQYLPTIHKASYDSVFDLIDYQKAVEYAQPEAASIYRYEAERIHNIQEKFLQISRHEQPYDVFLCYKESTLPDKDPNSRTMTEVYRTKDSVLAQSIYDTLTAKGLRVFFSRISLESKLGREYEPYIFSALQSAKVMLVIGTSADHIQSPWVLNEWKRYLQLKKQDRSKTLIPVIQGMDENELPNELFYETPRNLDEPGMMQDLIRGVLKLTGGLINTDPAPKYRQLIGFIRQSIDAHNFVVVPALAREILDAEPHRADVYLYWLLAEHQVTSLEELKIIPDDSIVNTDLFQNFRRYAKGELLVQAEGYETYCRQRKAYNIGIAHLKKKEYRKANTQFTNAGSYRDAEEQCRKCKFELDKEAYRKELQNFSQTVDSRMEREHSDMLEQGWKLHHEAVQLRCDKPRWKCTALSIVMFLAILFSLPDWVDAAKKAESILASGSIFYYIFLGSANLYFFGRANYYLKNTWNMEKSARYPLLLLVFYLVINIMVTRLSVPGFLPTFVFACINMAASVLWSLSALKKYEAAIAAADADQQFRKVDLPRIRKQMEQTVLAELNQKYLPLIGSENLKYPK